MITIFYGESHLLIAEKVARLHGIKNGHDCLSQEEFDNLNMENMAYMIVCYLELKNKPVT